MFFKFIPISSPGECGGSSIQTYIRMRNGRRLNMNFKIFIDKDFKSL